MKRFLLLSLISFLVLTAATTVYFALNLKPASSSSPVQDFSVNQGDGLKSIASRLKANHLIRDPYTFIIYSYYLGLNSKLQSGIFRLSSSMTTHEIISKLSKGGSHDYWLKIIDGNRVEEIASKFSNPKEFILKARDLEGYLYPDSYLIPQQFSVDQILDLIKTNFDTKISEVKTTTTLSPQQVVVLASLVEREARTRESKQMVAGILLNRLNIGMPLQVDASVQYARDSKLPQPKDYWRPIASADLKLASPFNTYLNPGLPPSPICSPSISSVMSVLKPVQSNFLFYVSNGDGTHTFTVNYKEHINAQKK